MQYGHRQGLNIGGTQSQVPILQVLGPVQVVSCSVILGLVYSSLVLECSLCLVIFSPISCFMMLRLSHTRLHIYTQVKLRLTLVTF